MREFIRSLVALRKLQGYTQAQVAAKMEVRQSVVSGIETGTARTTVQVESLQRYARAIGARLNLSYTIDAARVE